MAEEQTKQAMTPEQIKAVQDKIHADRNLIIDRLMPHFMADDSVPACIEASKYFFAYFTVQVLEGLRMSGKDINPDVLLDEYVAGYREEVMFIHQQVLMAPTTITSLDISKAH